MRAAQTVPGPTSHIPETTPKGGTLIDDMNPTPEKRAHKPFKASRKKASKPLEFTGEKVPRKTDQSFRPFSAPAEPSPPLAQASESAAANSAQPKQSEAGQPDCGLHQARSSPHDPVEDNTFEPVDDADGFVASTSRFPPPSEPPNQEDRRHGEEENWGAIRSEAQRRYVETFHSREQFLSTSMTASRCFWQQTVEERPASCPRCGEGGTLEPEGNRAAVLYVTQLHRFVLQVPLFLCSGCGQRTHAHPLSAHAFPGTPKWGFQLSLSLGSQRVPTWYSLDLLELYDSLTFNGKRGVVSLESFCAAIKGIHEKHGCTEPPLPADTFRKGFGKAWEEMGYIWHAAHDMRTFGVDGFEASPFASCAPCQGASPDQPLHSVYGDACFKIKHLARAGAASAFRKPHIQDNTFIPDNAVKAFLDIRESAVSAGESTCSEFKADSVYGAANPSIYDIPGYMGLFCRHGILGLGANVFGGERYGHPTLLLLTLLAVYGIPVQFFWYDIGCRYKIHVAAWLALQSPAIFPIANAVLAFSVMMQLARAITVVVPPFHQYAHSAACQAENSGKHAEGSGRASGEPPENAWSFFGTFNKVLQSRSLASRADFMSRLRGCYNEQRASSLPELLVRMNTKAQLQVEAAAAEILRISGEAVAAGIRLDEVPTGVQRPVVRIPNGKAWTVDYAKTLLQVWKLDDEATTPLPSLNILFGDEGGSFQKLDRASQYGKKLQKRLQNIEKEHGREIGLSTNGLPARWKPGDVLFRESYRLLRLVEVESLQRQIEAQVHELLYLQSCASKLGDRQGDLKKVRREMERGRGRVRSALGRLTEWKIDLVETVIFAGESETGEAVGGFRRRRSGVDPEEASGSAIYATEARGQTAWRLDGILKGDFPWLDEGSEPMQGSVGLRLKRKLESSEEDKRRGEEEKALVKLEMERTLVRYREQIDHLSKRKVSLEVESGVLSDATRVDYIMGSLSIVSLRKQRLDALLKRARVLFNESLCSPMRREELSAAAVEEASRSTAVPKSDAQSDSEVDVDFEWESDEADGEI